MNRFGVSSRDGSLGPRLLLAIFALLIFQSSAFAQEDITVETQKISAQDLDAIKKAKLEKGNEIPRIKSSRGGTIYVVEVNSDGTLKVMDTSLAYGSREGTLNRETGQIIWQNTKANSTPKTVSLQDSTSGRGEPKKFVPYSTKSQRVYGLQKGGGKFDYWTNGSSPSEPATNVNLEVRGSSSESPSRIGETLGWTPYAGREMIREQRDAVLNSRASSRVKTNVKNGAIYLSTGAATFYFAMGVIAAGEILLFEGGNPVALKRYFESMTDPVGVASVVGFLAAAAPFMKAAYSDANRSTFNRHFPLLTAGLVAGGLTSSLIATLGQDPLVRQCLRLDKVKEISAGKNVETDIGACEKVYKNWDTAQVTELMAPSLASIVGNGVVVFGAGYGLKNLVSALGKSPVLKGIRLPKLNLGQVDRRIGLLLSIGLTNTVVLEAFNLSEKLFEFEHLTKEKLLLNYSWQKDTLGRTLTESFGRMATYLGFAESTQFKDRETVEKLMIANDHLGKKLFSWRQLQLEATKLQIDRWKDKLSLFFDRYNYTHEIYGEVLKRIRAERSGKIAAGSPEELSWKNLDDVFINPEIYPQLSGEMEDPGEWKYVAARNLGEYIITSMACGPETQYRSHEFPWLTLSSFLPGIISPKVPQTGPLIRRAGFADDFRPPLITTPNSEARVCDQNPFGSSSSKFSPREYPVLAGVRGLDGKYEKVQAKSLLDYIRANVRSDILDSNNNLNFEAWWKTHVLGQVDRALDHYGELYDKVVRGPYRVALTDNSATCVQASPRAGDIAGPDSLANLVYKSNDCRNNQRTVMKGILPSLKSELDYYKILTRAALKASQGQFDEATAQSQFTAVTKQLEASIDDFIKAKVDSNSFTALSLLNERVALLEAIEAFKNNLPRPPQPTDDEIAEKFKSMKMSSPTTDKNGSSHANIAQSKAANSAGPVIPDEVRNEIIATITKKNAEEFYEKRPNLALVNHNLAQMVSLLTQFGIYKAMANPLDETR